jgi:hypothetical protein
LGFHDTNTFASGLEYWFHTLESGSFAARTGLNLGDPGRFWSMGFGWRILGAEVGYALQVPLSAGSRYDNTVSLIYRFGQWNPEREYEKMLGTELRYRQDLAAALDRSEARQKQLMDELKRVRDDMAALKSDLANKTAEQSQAKQRLQELEGREKRARDAADDLERKKRELAARSKESLYREDWAKYQKLKADGAPDLVLLERVKQILTEYQGIDLDLSEPRQELLRLQRNVPAP